MRLLALCALVLAASLQASQVRDVPQASPGTAMLTGLVTTDEPNGQPIRRALVTVAVGDGRQQYQTSTDDRGRFSVRNLPPGNVRLIVAKPGYVQTYYGARQPGSTVGLPIALTNGQTADVAVRLPRGAVITGTVRDESGQPMPGISLQVQRVTMSASGQRLLTSMPGSLLPASDDRGAFRLYGLPAGDYVVSALPRAFPGTDVRPTTSAELQWAERQLGSGRAGTPANVPADAAAAPPPGQTVMYGSVFYPGTVYAASAGIVSLAAGQERNGIDLKMQFVPTARVEGVVMNPSGQPAAGVQMSLVHKDDPASAGDVARLASLMELGLALGSSSRTDAAGAFSFAGVQPGAYIVIARTAPAGRGAGPVQAASAATQWAMTDVDVNGRDLAGLSLRLAAGQTVSGKFVFEGRTPLAGSARVSVSFVAADARGFTVLTPVQLALPDDHFETAGVIPAFYRASASLTGWTLKSITVAGRDVTDVPVEIKPGEDLSGVVVTFTDSPASVSGMLYDGANRPSSDLSIVLFSTNRAMWFPASRWIRPVVRPASDGRFTFNDLAPGEYYLAAVTDATAADLASAPFLEQVVPAAVKITVAAGEKKTQDLKIAR